MFLIREVLSCRPGKVGELKKKFKALSAVLEQMGERPFRLLTDVSGPPFWTLVVEIEAESFDGFLEVESRAMGNPDAQKAMAGYHELIQSGRREILRIDG